MNVHGSSTASSGLYGNTLFSDHKGYMEKIRSNLKETQAKLEQKEQNNSLITQTIRNDMNNLDKTSEALIRKSFMMQQRSPFPLLSTEARLKAL